MPDEPRTPDAGEATAEPSVPDDPPVVADPAARWRLVAGVLALALVASLVASGLIWRDRSGLQTRVAEAEGLAEAERAAEEAAVNAMIRMTTYHHKTVDEDYAWVEELGTEDFEQSWRPARDSAVELIKTVEARAEGAVINSAAEAVSQTEVRVLLFTDQELFQAGSEGSDLEETRVELTMVLEGGRWLIDEFEVQNFFAASGPPGGGPTGDPQPE